MTPESDEHVCREEESDAAQELDLVEEDSDQDNDVSVRRPQLPVRPLASVVMQPHPPHRRTWLFEILAVNEARMSEPRLSASSWSPQETRLQACVQVNFLTQQTTAANPTCEIQAWCSNQACDPSQHEERHAMYDV